MFLAYSQDVSIFVKTDDCILCVLIVSLSLCEQNMNVLLTK